MDLGLEGVHVLITGSSGGIGIETARLFLSMGANVSAHYNTKSDPLEPLISEYGPERIHRVQANLGVEHAVQEVFSAPKFGPVQVAIINHGIFLTEEVPIAHMSLEQWNLTINTNLTSSFLVAKYFLQGLEATSVKVKDKAAIVFIGSTAGKYGELGHADYASSKSAMMYGLTLTLKNEIVKIAPRGRVNCIAPGWVGTPMATESLSDPNILYRSLATTPLKKVATPLEVANQVVILASSVSSHVTGQVLMVEGGMEGRLLNSREDILGKSSN